MLGSARPFDAPADVFQPATDGAVDFLVPDLNGNTAQNRGIYLDVQVNVAAVLRRERGLQPCLLLVVELDRRAVGRR